MSKTDKELKQEFEAEYKIEPIASIKPHGYTTKQIDGNHYSKHTIQPWTIIDEYQLDYYLGNVIKYVLRDKNSQVIDLNKAIHYLEKKIELLESK